jgi:hypothetical protein
MELNERKPEEVFFPESVETYNRLHKDIWHRLIRLHHTIITLEQMTKFPWDFFYGPGNRTFWDTVWWNFLEIAIIHIYALTDDQSHDAHTLWRFRDRIIHDFDWIHEEDCESFQRALKGAKFDQQIKPVRDRVREIRHTFIAHRLLAPQRSDLARELPGVSLAELRELYDQTERLFRCCSFGSWPMTPCLDYMTQDGEGKPIAPQSLEGVFDSIAKDSEFVNEPERRAPYWTHIRRTKSEEQLQAMNRFRKKFGLPDA